MISFDACPLCGSGRVATHCRVSRKQFYYGHMYTRTHLGASPPPTFTISECRTCGVWFVNPRYETGEILACYEGEESGYRREGEASFWSLLGRARDEGRLVERWLHYKHLIEGLTTGRRIIDVGCGDGGFLAALGDQWDRTGVETSQTRLRSADRVGGVRFLHGDVTGLGLEPASFDVATLFGVVEHLEHPREVLTAVHRLLRPRGLVLVQTMDTASHAARAYGKRWAMIIPAVHLFYFSAVGLKRLLAEVGFVSHIGAYPTSGWAQRWARRYPHLAVLAKWALQKTKQCLVDCCLSDSLLAGGIRRTLQTAGLLTDTATCRERLRHMSAVETFLPDVASGMLVIGRKGNE